MYCMYSIIFLVFPFISYIYLDIYICKHMHACSILCPEVACSAVQGLGSKLCLQIHNVLRNRPVQAQSHTEIVGSQSQMY